MTTPRQASDAIPQLTNATVRALRMLTTEPETHFFLRQLAEGTELSKSATRAVLRRLERAQWVVKKELEGTTEQRDPRYSYAITERGNCIATEALRRLDRTLPACASE